MDFRPIDPIQPLFRGDTAGGVGTAGDSREQGSLFADIFQAAVFQNTAITVTAFVFIHIDIQSCIDRRTMGYRKLDLIDFNGPFCCLI